jgi:hypothetical protein
MRCDMVIYGQGLNSTFWPTLLLLVLLELVLVLLELGQGSNNTF